jgi:hypothetical protein
MVVLMGDGMSFGRWSCVKLDVVVTSLRGLEVLGLV